MDYLEFQILRHSNELYHHGIIGMKWGVRRYQNKDGTLTEEGKKRYLNSDGTYTKEGERQLSKTVRKIEKTAMKKHAKETGNQALSPFRTSTGKEYDRVINDYKNRMKQDPKYRELSKAAYDAEMKRLLSEKPYADDPEKLDTYWQSDKYYDLSNESERAARAKEKYAETIGKKYIDAVKDAKIRDLKITENVESAKKYLKNNFKWDLSYYDDNLEYNPDHWYDSWVEDKKFK